MALSLESILSALHVSENLARTGRNFIKIANAIDGIDISGLEEQIDDLDAYLKQIGKYGIKNGIKNGDFVDSSIWSKYLSGLTVANNIGTLLATGQNGQITQPANSIIGEKYYFTAIIKSTSNQIRIGMGNTYKYHSGNNQFEKLSLIHTATSTVHEYSIIDVRTSGWDNVFIMQAFGVNLTALFGVGNEPTAEIMDTLLEYYPNLLKFYDISVLPNKADKVQPAWITATLQNGWTGTLQYRKNQIGQLEIQGSITAGTITILTTISILPVGYRPSMPLVIPVIMFPDGKTGGRTLYLATNGEFRVPDTSNLVANQSVSFYGMANTV